MASALRAALSRHLRVSAIQTVTRHLRVSADQTVTRQVRVLVGQTVSVGGRGWSFLRSMSSCSQDSGYTDEEIMSTVLDIMQSNPHNKSVRDAIAFIKEHPNVQRSSSLFMDQVISKVLDFMENDPKVDRSEAYSFRIVIRCYSTDGTEDLSKDDVTSRVLYIVKRHPKVCASKVTEEAHFKDLGIMSMYDCAVLMSGLLFEFKLSIPDEMYPKIDSVKSAVGYILDHRHERIHRIELMKKLMSHFHRLSGSPPSEHAMKIAIR